MKGKRVRRKPNWNKLFLILLIQLYIYFLADSAEPHVDNIGWILVRFTEVLLLLGIFLNILVIVLVRIGIIREYTIIPHVSCEICGDVGCDNCIKE